MMNNISIVNEKCYGCYACEISCPNKCIKLTPNSEGFYYPIVEEDKCNGCGICLRKCPVKVEKSIFHTKHKGYALKLSNREELLNSASGGACHVISKKIIENGGIVFGCAFDDDLVVKHIEVSALIELKRLQSSKYVQSSLDGVYELIKKRLNENKEVLFTGTPCQVAGLYSFLGKKHEKLFTIDLICHGVPSPMLFKYYLMWQNFRINGKLTSFNFRDKTKKGWGKFYSIGYKSKKVHKHLALDKYGRDFLRGSNFRECCYSCAYSKLDRVGDISVGDFWGIEKKHPKLFSQDGVSCVLSNSERGDQLISRISELVNINEVDINDIISGQSNLCGPTKKPECRANYYLNFSDRFFFENQIKVGFLKRMKYSLPRFAISFIKKHLRR